MMRPSGITIAATLGLVAAWAVPATADTCAPTDVWSGAPERDVRLVRSGDRLLVLTGERVLVVGPGDAIAADHPRPPELSLDDPIVGVDGGFWQRRRTQPEATLARLGLDGLPTGERVVLGDTGGQIAVVDARGPLLAAAWLGAPAVDTRQDLHLRLMRADGTSIAAPVLPARPAALSVAPVVGNGVVWLVWNERPDLRIVGMRYDANDGHPLDAGPIPISTDVSPAYALGAAPVRVGAALRLYVTLTNGVQAFELGDDGTVTALPPTAPTGYLVGAPGGGLFQVAAASSASARFPQPGTVAITREQPPGSFASFVELPGIAAAAVGLGDGLAVATVVDTAAGDAGTSQVVLRRLDATGAALHTAVLVQTALVRGDGLLCDDEDTGCAAGGADAGLVPSALALALVLVLGRRRGARDRRRRAAAPAA